MAPVNKQRLYDVPEYAERVKASLVKLEERQKPGEQTGKGSKTDVLCAAREEIEKLLEKGYTAKQIAEALHGDVFGILPKTITQLFAAKRPKRLKPAQSADTKKTQTPAPAARKALNTPGTFTIKKDSDDL